MSSFQCDLQLPSHSGHCKQVGHRSQTLAEIPKLLIFSLSVVKLNFLYHSFYTQCKFLHFHITRLVVGEEEEEEEEANDNNVFLKNKKFRFYFSFRLPFY